MITLFSKVIASILLVLMAGGNGVYVENNLDNQGN